MLLPFLMRTNRPKQKVAILTLDERFFDQSLLTLAGASNDSSIVIAGIENTRCHELMSRRDNPTTWNELTDAVVTAADRVTKHNPVSAFLLECAGFGPAAPLIREKFGKPVWDATDNARLVMAGVKIARY